MMDLLLEMWSTFAVVAKRRGLIRWFFFGVLLVALAIVGILYGEQL